MLSRKCVSLGGATGPDPCRNPTANPNPNLDTDPSPRSPWRLSNHLVEVGLGLGGLGDRTPLQCCRCYV